MTNEHDLSGVSDEALWAELARRRAALHVGFCYPAMCSDDAATQLVREHGYEYGPFELLELGHKLSEPPQWPLYARTPDEEWARRVGVSAPAEPEGNPE